MSSQVLACGIQYAMWIPDESVFPFVLPFVISGGNQSRPGLERVGAI